MRYQELVFYENSSPQNLFFTLMNNKSMYLDRWPVRRLTLFLPAMGGISPYMNVTWPSPVGIGLRIRYFSRISAALGSWLSSTIDYSKINFGVASSERMNSDDSKNKMLKESFRFENILCSYLKIVSHFGSTVYT